MCALGASAQEAYAWYSPGSNSLTFCYDNERSNPATDCNQDGTVNINDATALIDYLLNGVW